MHPRREELLMYVTKKLIDFVSFFAQLHFMKKALYPGNSSKKSEKATKDIIKRLGRPRLKYTTSHEKKILADGSVVDPDEIKVKFDSIGGLEGIKKSLYETAILPLRRPELFNSDDEFFCPAKGVLLYGPPGTGKTMLAKAIAKESRAIFINVNISNLQNMWHGETEKNVSAIFSLAFKLEPCIIFLDEVDTILSQRQSSRNEVTRLKTVFMTLWDGFATDKKARVMVLAATNRPSAIDEAILRRLPKSFEVGLPDRKGRAEILKVYLKGDRVDINSINFEHVAALCDKYSGSDLLELCKQAAYLPIREHLEDEENNGKSTTSKPRKLTQMDLEKAIATSKRTKEAADEFQFGSSKLSYYI